MVELVDTLVLETNAEMRMGSNPFKDTNKYGLDVNGSIAVSKTESRGSNPLACAKYNFKKESDYNDWLLL